MSGIDKISRRTVLRGFLKGGTAVAVGCRYWSVS